MKTVVITGASSGIGLAVCAGLLRRGYRVICVSRTRPRPTGLAPELLENMLFVRADLLEQSGVTGAAGEILGILRDRCGGGLYGLVNNAGCTRSRYMTTQEGYEHQFALNHLAGFLLAVRLLPCLEAAGGRVLVTSSRSHRGMKMHWDDLMFRGRYSQLPAYKQSKLANMLFVLGFNSRFGGRGMRAYGIDPGLVRTEIGLKDTDGLGRLVWRLRMRQGRPPELAAETFFRLLEEEPAPAGIYFRDCREEKHSREVNRHNADRLWAISAELCGVGGEGSAPER